MFMYDSLKAVPMLNFATLKKQTTKKSWYGIKEKMFEAVFLWEKVPAQRWYIQFWILNSAINYLNDHIHSTVKKMIPRKMRPGFMQLC